MKISARVLHTTRNRLICISIPHHNLRYSMKLRYLGYCNRWDTVIMDQSWYFLVENYSFAPSQLYFARLFAFSRGSNFQICSTHDDNDVHLPGIRINDGQTQVNNHQWWLDCHAVTVVHQPLHSPFLFWNAIWSKKGVCGIKDNVISNWKSGNRSATIWKRIRNSTFLLFRVWRLLNS